MAFLEREGEGEGETAISPQRSKSGREKVHMKIPRSHLLRCYLEHSGEMAGERVGRWVI